jgi:hypothetical protein
VSARPSPAFFAVLSLALLGAGPCRALSLRSSAAELFLGDVLPGADLVVKADDGKLRVENSGRDPIRVAFKVVSPSASGLKDGFDAWPYLDRARATNASRAELKAEEAARAGLSVAVPKDPALVGRQFELDVVATGTDRAGATLTLKTRVLFSVGPPLSPADPPAGGYAERPGFALAPPSASGREATFKIVNASEEDLTVTLAPAREWDDDVRILEGYEPAPNPRWLHVEPGELKIRAGAIGRARVWAEPPKEARYAGRRWAFVAAVDGVAGGRRTRRYFVLHADVERLEEENHGR